MATCFEFNSCHLNTSSHCTWMNLRQRQHSCQEMSPSGLELSYFLGTCFLRSRNPLSCEVKWWVKLLGMDEEYGPTDCGGTLEQESFSHNKSPLGQRTSHFPRKWNSETLSKHYYNVAPNNMTISRFFSNYRKLWKMKWLSYLLLGLLI